MKTEELNWKGKLLREIKKVQATNTAVRENNTISFAENISLTK
jgi:hypothetical protein